MHNSGPVGGHNRNSRRLIAGLLLVSCVAALILLLTLPAPVIRTPLHSEELDRLIEETFEEFRIHGERIRTQSVRVDTLMMRKIYTVSLPPWTAATHWHYELHKKLLPFGASAPARVHFPGEEMNIHIVYRDKVVRTIRLRKDPDDEESFR